MAKGEGGEGCGGIAKKSGTIGWRDNSNRGFSPHEIVLLPAFGTILSPLLLRVIILIVTQSSLTRSSHLTHRRRRQLYRQAAKRWCTGRGLLRSSSYTDNHPKWRHCARKERKCADRPEDGVIPQVKCASVQPAARRWRN